MAQAVPSVAAPRSPSPLDGGVDCLTFPDDGDDVGVYSHFPSARCHGEREGYSSRGCQRCDKHHPSPLKQDEAETERAAEPVTAEPPFSLSPASPSTVYRPVTIDGHTKEGNVVEFYAAAVFVTNPSYFDNLNYRNSSTLRPPTGNQWSPQGIHAKRLGSPATGNRPRTQSLQRHGSRRGPFNIGGMVNQASHSRNGGRPATQPGSRGASRGHSSSAPRVTPVQRGMAVLQYYTAKQELDAHLQLSDGDANDSNPTEDEDFYHAHGDLPSFVRSRSHHGPRLQVASPPLSRPSPHDDSTAATELLSNTGLGDTQEFNVMLKNGLASPELPGSRPTQSNLFRLSRPPPVPQQQVHASRVPGASPLDTRALGLSDSQMSSSLEMEDTGIANDSRLEVVDLPGGGQWKLSSPIYQLSSLPRRPLIPSPPQQGLQKGSMVLTDGEGSPYRRLSRCTLKPSSRHSACAADSGVLPQWPPLQSDAPDGAAARLEAVLSREEKVYLLRREVRMFEREYCVNRGYPIATPKLDTIMSSIVAEHFAGRKEELDGAIGRPGKKEEEHRPLLDHAIRQCVQEAQERRAPAAAAVRATGSPAVEKNYALSGALVSLTAPPTGMTQGSSSTCRPQSGRLGAKSRDGGPGAGRAGSPAPALTGLGHLRPREVMRLVEEQQKAEKARQEEQRKADLLTEQIYGALDRLQVAHALPRSAAAAATTSARKDGDLEETAPPTLGVTTRSLSATNAQASTTAGAGATLAGTTRSSSPKTQSMTPTSPVSPQKHASPFEVLGHGRLDLHAVGGVPLAKSFSLQLDATTNGRPLSPSHKSVPARELSSSSQEPPRHPNNNPDIISPEESCRQLLFSSQLVLNSHSLPFGGPGPRVAAAETARRRAAGDEFARPATKDAPPLLSGNTTTLFAPTVGSSSSGGAGAPGRIGISHSPSDAALPVPLSVPGISPSAGLTSSTETPMAQAGLDAAATSAAHARASFPDRLARSLRLHEPLHHCVRCAARLVVFTLMRTLPKPLYEGDSVDFDVLIQEEERCATEALQWEVERQAERWEAEQRRLAKAARSPAEPNPSPFPSSPQETCSPLARAATTPSVRPTPSGPSEATSPSCMAARVKGFEDRDTMSESSLPVSPTAAALRTERSTSEVEASGRASSAELLRHARAHKRDGELTPDESYGAYTDCSETERLRRRLHRPNYRGSLRSIGDDDLAGSSVTDMPSKGSASRAAHRPVVSVLKAARKEEEAVGEELERTFADAANHSIPIFMMRSNAAAYTSLLSLFQTARGRHAPMGAFGANAGGPPQGDPESHARVLRQVGDLLQRSRDSNARLTQEERDVLQSFLEESRHATENSAVAPTTDLLASIVREKSELPPQTDRFGRPTSLGALLTMTHGGFGVAPFSGDMYNYLLQHRELEDCLLHGGPTDGAPMTDLERRAAVVRHIIEPEPALLPLVTLMNVLRTCTSSNVVLPYHQAELLLGPIELRLLLDVMRSFAALSFSLSQEEDGAGVAKGAGKEEFGAFFYRIHREELLEWSCVVICEAAVGYAMSLAGEGVAGFPLVSYASTSTLTEEQVDAVLESELPAKSLPNVPFSKFNRQVAYSVVEKNRSVVLEALVRLKGELYYLLTGVDECSRLLDMHQRLLEQVRASSLKEQKIRSSAMAKNQTQARVLKHSGGACAGGGGRSGRAGSSRGASIRPAHKRSFRLDHSHHTSTPLTHGGVGDERTNTSGPQRGRCSTKTSPTTRRMTSRLTSHQPSRQASVPPSRRGSGRLRSVAVPASETSMSCTPSHHPDSANRGGAAELTFVELIDTEATTASPVKAVPPTVSTNNSRAGGNTSVGGGSKKRQRGLACNPLQTVFLSLPGNVSTTSLLAHSATAPPQAGSLSRRGSLQTDKPAGTTAPVAKGNAPPTVGVPRGGHGGPQLSMEGTAPPAVEANLPVLGSADFSTSRGGVGSSAVAGIYKPPMAITRGSNHTSSIMEGEGANGRATTICPQHQRGESRGSSGIFSMTPSSPLGHGRGAAAEAGGEESGGTEDGGAARTKQQRRHVRTALSVLPSRLGIHTVLQDMQELENERASNNRTNPLLTGAIYEHGGAMAVEHILPSTTPAQAGGDDAVDEAEDVAAGLMPNSFRSQRSATRNALKSVWEPTSYIPSAIPSKATHKKSGTGDGGGAKSGGRSPSSPSGQKGVEPNKAGMHCPTHLLRKYSTFVLEEDEGVMASEQRPTTEDEEASGTPTRRRKPGDEDEEIFEVIIGANEAEHCEEAAEVERIRQWLMRHGGVVDATATTGETEMPLLPDAMGSSLVDRPGSPSPHTTTLPPPPFQATHPSNNPEKRLRNVKPTAWYAHGKPSFERHRLESKLQRLRPKGLFDLNSISPLIALNACINTDGMDEEDRRASATFLGTGHLAQRKSSVAARSPLEAEFRANPFVRSSTAGHRRPPARAHLVRRSSPLAGSTTSRPSSSMSATTIKRAVVPTAAQQAQRVCLRERGLRMGQQLMPWTIK